MLRAAQAFENDLGVVKAKAALFGSLAHGDRGNILGGSLTEFRYESFWDLLEKLVPYENIERPSSGNQKTAVDEETARNSFVEEYKRMVAEGLI